MTPSSPTTPSAPSAALACIGGAAEALIEARFLRVLSPREHQALETHLLACVACCERYRQLQLAHRVAALGPDRALDEPAPLELERIAQDLGLLDPALAPGLLERLLARPRRQVLGLALALAASVALVAVVLPPRLDPDELVERGAASWPVSFSAFAVSPAGEVQALAPGVRVSRADSLKLRVAFAEHASPSALAEVRVVLQAAAGPRREVHLGPPGAAGPERVATVPGAVPLDDLGAGPGAVAIWVLGVAVGPALDPGELERALVDRPAAAEVRARLGARVLGVERFDLELDAAGGPAP